MRIAEIRRPSDFTPSPARRQSFYLTGGVVPVVVNYPWLRAQRSFTPEDRQQFQQPYRRIYFPLTGGVVRQTVQPFFIASRAAVYLPTFLNPVADAQLFINGLSINWLANPGDMRSSSGLATGVSLASLTITKTLGQSGTMTFAMLSTAGALPQAYDEVIFYRFGIRRFGGFVAAVSDVLIVSTHLREYGVQCTDNMGLLDRVVVAKYYTIPMSGSVIIVIDDFVFSYLNPDFGVTLGTYEGQPAVAIGPILFHYVLMSSAVAQLLQQASGWYVIIDAYKVLHLRNQANGRPVAPYSLSNSVANFEACAATESNSEYRNKQWVLPSVNTQSFWTDTRTGDGATRVFETQYPLNLAPVVTVAGVAQRVTVLGAWTLPWDFYYISGGIGVFSNPANPPVGAGVQVLITYPSPFQLAVSAENDAEIARVGLVEAIYSPTDAINQVQAQNLADAILANYCPSVPSELEYNTNEIIEHFSGGWVEPGDTLASVNLTEPLASGDYLVQSITSQMIDLAVFKHNIVARLQNGATDYAAVLAKLTQQALSQSNNTDQVTLTFEIGTTVIGLTNPGLSTGVQPNVQIYPQAAPGVIAGWTLVFPVSPPTGAALLIDILQNGVSIFPTGVYATMPDSQTTEEDGAYFKTANIIVNLGDQFTLNVVQVGSTFGGADGVLQVVVKH